MADESSERFELTVGELREVARFAAGGAQQTLAVFEAASPGDLRPRAAVEAAWVFANGERRSRLQRVTAVDAHRAAKAVPSQAAQHAAYAAGDAAASAYLHPLAKTDQVGHILRADAHAACAVEIRDGDESSAQAALDDAVSRATPVLLDVLRRYPPAADGTNRVGVLMQQLDLRLRRL